jgi:hypothetical protein
MNLSDPDDLDAKLHAWTVEARVPSSFQREVWQRIATRQAARDGAFWPGLARGFFTLLTRPQYAFVIFLVSLSTGLGLAYEQAQFANARHWKELEARYAGSIDPLSMNSSVQK